jgi:hypothetical protein
MASSKLDAIGDHSRGSLLASELVSVRSVRHLVGQNLPGVVAHFFARHIWMQSRQFVVRQFEHAAQLEHLKREVLDRIWGTCAPCHLHSTPVLQSIKSAYRNDNFVFTRHIGLLANVVKNKQMVGAYYSII